MILVIIATYNAREWLGICLAPFALDREGIDVLVVDNASHDGTADAIVEEYPFVRLLRRPTNIGFGAANSIGIEWAIAKGYKGVFLLNQDATITSATIRLLADRVEQDPTIGLASPVHRSAENGDRERGFSHYAGGTDSDNRAFVDLPFINAALWYLPRKTIESVGIFCPLFFHYGEDVDYYNRVISAGLRAGYYPDLSAVHYRQNGELSMDKQMHLTRAYHLTEYVHPSSSFLRRLWRGPVMLALNGLKGHLGDHLRSAQALWAERERVALWCNRPSVDLDGLKRAYTPHTPIAPILLLLYDRPRHTRRILDLLMRQPEIVDTPLFILADGAKDSEQSRAKVAEVREIAEEYISKLPYTTLWTQETNVGLAHNVTEGVSRVLEQYDRIIVVEDDLILSPYFLRWMRDALLQYEHVSEVAHVHAGTFYTHRRLRPNHLLSFAGSWGWGTWRDRWQTYWDPDGEKLLLQMNADPSARRHFDYGGYQCFTRMLWRQTRGLNNSWAVRWHANIVLHHLLSVNANPPLVSNGGFDGSGTHSSADNRYATPVAPYPLYAPAVVPHVEEDKEAYAVLKGYYQRTNNKVAKAWYKLIELLGCHGKKVR